MKLQLIRLLLYEVIVTYPQYDRLVSFASVHHGLRAEKLLAAAGIEAAAAPTPREVDISCGQCLLFAGKDEQRVLALLETNNVRWSKLFNRDGRSKIYDLIRMYDFRRAQWD